MQYLTFPCRAVRTAKSAGVALLALSALAAMPPVHAAPADAFVLPGHIPAAVARAQAVSRVDATRPISLALTLPLRNQSELSDLLHRLYDPSDPLFGHYLTPDQFTAKFGPTQEDYNRVIAYAQANGLTITNTHPNRTILDVSAPAAIVENAFGVHLLTYQSQTEGRYFYAPDANPKIPTALTGVVSGVIGLDNAAVWHPNFHPAASPIPAFMSAQAFELPHEVGSGPSGGLTPTDIKTAYNLSSVTQDGAGQTLGLYELDGYTASDITAYETYYGLPNVPLTNVMIDGFDGTPGGGAGEVTLDIELQIALAPKASKIIVYEAPEPSVAYPNSVVDLYNKIATDNLAKEISTSWGLDENSAGSDTLNAENQIFQQMAMQGQSIFAAAGDSGAYDNGSSLSVDDPASQPFMVGVGGTALTVQSPGVNEAYKSETTWAEAARNIGGGGGISTVWPIPSYQSGLISAASKGSTTARNVPDVSLDADPDASGYSIYFGGAWTIEGGTSCAAPLWAAFTALVNQDRLANRQKFIGFANPQIYIAAQKYNATDFHDINDGSTNFYYPAVKGLDDATGWGTFNGANLLKHLGSGPLALTAPAAPTNLKAADGSNQVVLTWTSSPLAASYNVYRSATSGAETLYKTNIATTTYTDTGVVNGKTYYYKVTGVNNVGEGPKSNEAVAYPQAPKQYLTNGGFENGVSKPAPWTASAGVIDDTTTEPAHSGNWKAYLDGYGVTHTDTLASAAIAIPANITTATLNFYLAVDTSETTTTTPYDTLTFQVRDKTGKVLGTVATFSNLTALANNYYYYSGYYFVEYVPESVNLLAYKGQAVQLYIIGKEDNSLQTSFLLDDFSLITQ